jgi:hypothetical protein
LDKVPEPLIFESEQAEPFSTGPVRRGVAWRVVEDRPNNAPHATVP